MQVLETYEYFLGGSTKCDKTEFLYVSDQLFVEIGSIIAGYKFGKSIHLVNTYGSIHNNNARWLGVNMIHY